MENSEYYLKNFTPPETALKTITGGRISGMTDINPQWRITALNDTFGLCGFGWKYVITKQWLETGGKEEKAAFVNIELFVKVADKWSDAIQGTGGSSFIALEKSGFYTSDECFKMALTDAISVACKAIGIGGSIYMGSKYQKKEAELKPETKKEAPKAEQPKELAKPTLDEKALKVACDLIKSQKTLDDVKKVWSNHRHFQTQKAFIDAKELTKVAIIVETTPQELKP